MNILIHPMVNGVGVLTQLCIVAYELWPSPPFMYMELLQCRNGLLSTIFQLHYDWIKTVCCTMITRVVASLWWVQCKHRIRRMKNVYSSVALCNLQFQWICVECVGKDVYVRWRTWTPFFANIDSSNCFLFNQRTELFLMGLPIQSGFIGVVCAGEEYWAEICKSNLVAKYRRIHNQSIQIQINLFAE